MARRLYAATKTLDHQAPNPARCCPGSRVRIGHPVEVRVVVAYSNSSVYVYNIAIRRALFPGIENPVPGDRVVVVHNNYLHGRELLNGETGTLVSINNDRTHTHQVVVRLPRNLSEDESEFRVTLRFREAVIRFADASGIYDIACMIMDNVLFSGRRDLTYLENVALLVDFKNRWGKMNKSDRDDFRTALRGDPFFNAVRVKFGYALTCHKAQGGEWKNVFVNCATGMGYNSEYYFRWLYTAITRAREQLLLINPPSFNQTRLMREAGTDKTADSPETTAFQTEKPGISGTDTENGQPVFHENLTERLKAAANAAGYETNGIKQLPYCIQFTMSNSNSSALIRVYYSARNRVTAIEGLNGAGEAGPEMLDAFGFLNLPMDKKKFHVRTDRANKNDDTGPVAQSFLNDFRQRIEEFVVPYGISIVKTESYSYHEIYYFDDGLKQTVLKFHYNKKRQFTRYEVIKPKSNGLEDVLIPLLKNLDL